MSKLDFQKVIRVKNVKTIMIPKEIHITHSTSRIHPVFKKNIENIRQSHKDWNLNFYTDNDILEFISYHYGKKYLNYYKKINPAYGPARSDFFRYLLMFKIGGAYFDIKSKPTTNLNNIILNNDRYLLSYWGKSHPGWGNNKLLNGKRAFQQWFIICEPLHPFLSITISNVVKQIVNYKPKTHGVGKFGVLNVTGPVAYTNSILSIMDFHVHRLIDSESSGLKYSIFEGQGNLSHEHFFEEHYSLLNEPIVLE
jgi:inositol phosphorylceramide mannosyltransferase catalytic subunit